MCVGLFETSISVHSALTTAAWSEKVRDLHTAHKDVREVVSQALLTKTAMRPVRLQEVSKISRKTATYNLFSVFASQLLDLKGFPGPSDYSAGVENVVATLKYFLS